MKMLLSRWRSWLAGRPRLGRGLALVAALTVIVGGAALGSRMAENARFLPVPRLYQDRIPEVVQELDWGAVRQKRVAPGDTMFATTGRRLYVVGDVDGGFRPRSNPYDLYAFGEPSPGDPLADEMQGVWAQPVKALDGYGYVVRVDGTDWPLLDAQHFTQTFAGVQFGYQHGRLRAARQDFVPQDLPMLFTTLTLQNEGPEAADVRLAFLSYFDLEDAWFTSLAQSRNAGEVVKVTDGQIVARARGAPDSWAVAAGGDLAPLQTRVTRGPDGTRVGQFEYAAHLAAGEARSWTFAIGVEVESGAGPASAFLSEWLPKRDILWAEKQALYEKLLTEGPRFHSPDPKLDAAFDLARANMQMLEAESPALGGYFYAGLEMFPFWFSADGYYSIPGLLASNLVSSARNHVLLGTQLQQEGRIPHQVSPSGRMVGAGNAQETPQWVMAVWDAFRWTGDRDLLAALYPTAVKGLFDYTLATADRDGDRYPEGPAMVEKPGMGPEKVDSAGYLWAALRNLEEMATVLGDVGTAARAREAADGLQATFDGDWWLPEQQLYADSVQGDANTPLYTGQWSTVVPLEVGIAPVDHARAELDRLQREHLNDWGLVHTLGSDERVWTLPSAALSRGAYRYGDPELGLAMLQHLAQTLDHGSIGMFHELIPEGLSFLQLWSGATLVRGVVEDLMGIQVRADLHAVTIAPQLAAAWDSAELEDLRFGGHTITVRAMHTGITVTHTGGPGPLAITYRSAAGSEVHFSLAPGKTHTIGE